MVAIARALSFEAQVVILDEPTAALSQHEILEFYQIVERLKQEGKAILFISHKFDEIFELADHYTILRDGVYVDSGAINTISEERMVAMMVGRAITQSWPKVHCEPGETVLEVRDLCHPTEFAHITFSLRRGWRDPWLYGTGRRGSHRADASPVRRFTPLIRRYSSAR